MTAWVPANAVEASVADAMVREGVHVASMEEALNILVKAYHGYKGAYETEVGERSGRLGRISTLESERDGYKAAYDSEVALRSQLDDRISTLESERDGYKDAYDSLVAKLAELHGRISSLESERDGYKCAYETEVGQLAALHGRISTLESERDGYKGAYDAEVAGRAEKYGRISSLEAERDGYRRSYETIRAQLERTREQLRAGADTAALDPGPRQPTRRASVGVTLAQPSADEDTMIPEHEFDRLVLAGREDERAGQRDRAIANYIGAMRLMHRYGPAKVAVDRIARDLLGEAVAARDGGDDDGAIGLLVKSLELNPDSQEVRDTLQAVLDKRPGRDLTQECLIFPDAARATRFYRHAIQTCMDFVVHGGIEGDILEFGVLGGWTARHFAEISRDMAYYGDLHLFDSFEGLPRMKGNVDLASYDVSRGLWREEMVLPKSWEDEIGATIDVHVKQKLSQVISPSRIKIRKGFYSDTLQAPLGCKAALVHMDCDLYQSTVEVFQALERDAALQDGTVIMFDDWNCNRANPAFGQRRAFREFLERNKGRWDTSHYLNYGFNCAAFILHKLAP